MATYIYLVTLLISAPAPMRCAVVALAEVDPYLLEHAAAQCAEFGGSFMGHEEALSRLGGIRDARLPDLGALHTMLTDARDREARFETKNANALRMQILHAFDGAGRLSEALAKVAAYASHDIAAALLAEGNGRAATLQAVESLRRFDGVALDPSRHSPAIHELFARARKQLQKMPRATLLVQTDQPGRLFVDGTDLGEIDSSAQRTLPIGDYRVWLLRANGLTSLPYPIEITKQGPELKIFAELDARLRIAPTLTLECEQQCESDLVALGKRLRVDRIIAVSPGDGEGPTGIDMRVDSGKTEAWRFDDSLLAISSPVVDRRRPRFSPWSLVPFGAGQFAQSRPVFGASYAAIETGLLGWHLVAWQRHAAAAKENDFRNEPERRRQRNLSAIVLYSVLAANVIEAVVVGIATGE